jgi:hypothetical protein
LWFEWYFEEMRIIPNKKDVIHHRIGHKSWETQAAHFLQENEARFNFPLHVAFLVTLQAMNFNF